MDMEFLEDSSCEERYRNRKLLYLNDRYGAYKYYGYWLLHNCIAHLILGIFPTLKIIKFHRLTSDFLNHKYHTSEHLDRLEKNGYFKFDVKEIKNGNRFYWLLHNCIIHPLMGIFPCKLLFSWHDTFAKKMNVLGWV